MALSKTRRQICYHAFTAKLCQCYGGLFLRISLQECNKRNRCSRPDDGDLVVEAIYCQVPQRPCGLLSDTWHAILQKLEKRQDCSSLCDCSTAVGVQSCKIRQCESGCPLHHIVFQPLHKRNYCTCSKNR